MSGRTSSEQRAEILNLQPHPTKTLVAYLQVEGGWVSGITREWEGGATGRCRLCPQCKAVEGTCLVLVGGVVPKESAALFRVVGPGQSRRVDGLAM